MGWSIYPNKISNPKAECDSLCTWSNAVSSTRILKSSMVGSTYYAAAETTNHETGVAEVWAAVFLTRNRKDGFGHKDMCETVGPIECACPMAIFKMLSPLKSDDKTYANIWRERVLAHHASQRAKAKLKRSIQTGDVLTFAEPLSFRNGLKEGKFLATTKSRWGGKESRIFYAMTKGFHCRLSGHYLTRAVVTPAAEYAKMKGVTVAA